MLQNQNRSRAPPSRQQSRATSPALSIKSRKSTMSTSAAMRTRNNYIEHELTDDEDSDSDGYVDDFRSLRGRRESSARSTTSRRSRKNSTTSFDGEGDDGADVAQFNRANGNRSSLRSNRDRRSGSIARSVQSGWAPKPLASSEINRSSAGKKAAESVVMTPDSESSEAGTKAMVQAKIREKLAQQSSLDESSSDFWRKPKEMPAAEQRRQTNQTDVQLRLPERSMSPIKSTTKIEPVAVVHAVAAMDEIVEPVKREDIEPDVSAISLNQIADEDLPVGPPPSAPQFEWECEFCTFVNEANTKICMICCKTPVTVPAKKTADENGTTAKPEPVQKLTVVAAVESNKSTSETVSSSGDNNNIKDTHSATKHKGKTRKISFWPGTKSK